MAIFRVEHNTNYTVISNKHLRDRRLSLKAKGLLTYMLSMPNDWDFSLAGLTSNLKEGIESIRKTLAELKENGYLGTKKARKANGSYYYLYYVYEHPREPNFEEEVILSENNKVVSEDSESAEENKLTEKSEAIRLAERLHEKILANKPNRKIEKKWRTNWSLDIEKLHRIDKREYKQIELVLDWSQDNEFWRTNILSGKKLRDKFDRLEDDMKRENGKRPKVFDLNKPPKNYDEDNGIESRYIRPEPVSKPVPAPRSGKIETPEEIRKRLWGIKK